MHFVHIATMSIIIIIITVMLKLTKLTSSSLRWNSGKVLCEVVIFAIIAMRRHNKTVNIVANHLLLRTVKQIHCRVVNETNHTLSVNQQLRLSTGAKDTVLVQSGTLQLSRYPYIDHSHYVTTSPALWDGAVVQANLTNDHLNRETGAIT